MSSSNRHRSKAFAAAAILGLLAIWMAWRTARGEPIADPLPPPSTCPAGMQMEQVKMPFSARPLGMVKIPPGKIEMPTTRPGAPTETVEIRSIWVSMTEVTWDGFDPYYLCRDMPQAEGLRARSKEVNLRPSEPHAMPDRGLGHEGYGTISITYRAANDFCRFLSKQTGKNYRLPTEAEWEYACRCGGPALRPAQEQLEKIAWFAENSQNENLEPVPHPVGGKAPNAWGLYDMLGNVGEWVMGYDGKPVLKGGTYMDSAKDIHSGMRAKYRKEWQLRDCQRPQSTWWLSDGPHAGFRVVRED